jgi:ABC-2 type transport system ATP-binding protein
MSEMALTADHLIVVGRGELIADVDVEEFVAMASTNEVLVRSPQASELRQLLAAPDVTITSQEAGLLEVRGVSAESIGDIAFEHHIRLHELAVRQASLEEAFMEMTRDSVEFHAHTTNGHADEPERLGETAGAPR